LVRRGPQRLIEDGLVEFRIGGDDDEHRRQARGEHARALGNAADGEPAGTGAGGGLRDSVGGHDRFGGGLSGFDARVGSGDEWGEVAHDGVAEVLASDTDESGRADEDILGGRGGAGVGEKFGGGLRGQRGGLVAEVAGVAVRSPGVEDDGTCLTIGRSLLGPQDRVGFAAVGRVDGGDSSIGSVVDDQ
jgi:hypothetical protein